MRANMIAIVRSSVRWVLDLSKARVIHSNLEAELLYQRFLVRLSQHEFLAECELLDEKSQKWLIKACSLGFNETGRPWLGEAADEIARRYDYCDSDTFCVWEETLKTRDLGAVEDLCYSCKLQGACLLEKCIAAFAESNDPWFEETAYLIADLIGWPNPFTADWGVYRDGEQGPGAD